MATAYDRMVKLDKYRKEIDEATAAGDLLDPKELMMGLYAHGICGQDLKNVIKMQADIAKRRDNRKWLSTAAREAAMVVEETFLDSSWVDENLYMVWRVPKKTKRWTGATKCTTDIRKKEDPSVETISEDAAAGSSAGFSGTAAGTEPVVDASSITVTVDNLPVIRSVEMSVSSSEQSEEDVPKRQWSFERSISMTESQPGPIQECVEIPSRSRETRSTPNKVEGHGDSVLKPPCSREVRYHSARSPERSTHRRQRHEQASGSSRNRERSLHQGTEQERPSRRGNRQEKSSSPFRSRRGEIKESSRSPAQVGSHSQKRSRSPVPEEEPERGVKTMVFWSSRPESAPASLRQGKRKLVPCSIPGCGEEVFNMKEHIEQDHAPAVFDYYQHPSMELTRSWVQCLVQMVQAIFGESAILQDMVDYINNRRSIAPGWFVTPEQQAAMVDMCQASGWEKPDEFSLDPVNSAAALMHWRCLGVFAAEISRQQMEQLRLSYPACEPRRGQTSTVATDYALQSGQIQFREELQLNVYQEEVVYVPQPGPSYRDASGGSFPQPGNSSDALTGTFPQPGNSSRDESPYQQTASSVSTVVIPMYDSHFHLDRLSTTVGEQLCSLNDICRVCPLPEFENHTLKLTGATASFCDRETLPRPEDIASLVRSGFKVMVGAHPKVILSPEERWRVKSLVQLPDVSGLGEVGLDHTTSPDLWHRQERQLKDLVTGLEPSKVLTLHVRGMNSDATGVEAFMRCLDILSPISPGSRRVQLHCFTGSKEVVEEWLESFPYTYFSFTNMVSRFTTRQRRALRAIPRDRLLLETDAPYFVPRGRNLGSPSWLYPVAEAIARVLEDVSPEEVLELTETNAQRLFH